MIALAKPEYATRQTMIARTQYQMTPGDLELTLTLVRGGTLARAGERLGVDASTVFRALQRIERGLGRLLFERTRLGYLATELATELAEHAERMEATLEAARSTVASAPSQVSGTVRITTTDTVLHGLVAPALQGLRTVHPLLGYELHTGNELVGPAKFISRRRLEAPDVQEQRVDTRTRRALAAATASAKRLEQCPAGRWHAAANGC
jgi:DNA-binding transcriptional LysR family regulator